jgi:predicted phosphodiesterase
MIRGNNEGYLVVCDSGDVSDARLESKQWALMRWSYRQLDRETLDFIASLPEQLMVALDGTAPIRVVHGSPRDPTEGLCPNRDPAKMRQFREAKLIPPDSDPIELGQALADIVEPVLVCGHTHIPWEQELDGRLVLNPGAVCGPLNGDVRAQYALLTWHGNRWSVQHRAVSYDLGRIRAAFRESGVMAVAPGLARAFLLSIETGRNVGLEFVLYADRLAVEAGVVDRDVVPDDVWDLAVATFDWDEYTKQRVVA